MKRHSLAFFAILLLLCVAVGCGGHVPMTGTVVFDDDGSPLTHGVVILSTPTFQSRGELDSQGRFTMGSYGVADGLPPGTYGVAVVAVETISDTLSYSLIDPKYSNPEMSGLTLTIEGAIRNYEIRVERNPRPRPGG